MGKIDDVDPIEAIRRFNRRHVQRLGLLTPSFLDTGRPYLVSRVLFEIGAEGCAVQDLRRRLEIDSGHLSRLLRRLEGDGLIEMEPHPDDGRRRVAQPTATGEREIARLDQRSSEQVGRLIESLRPTDRDRLAEALQTASRLLDSAAVVATAAAVDSAAAKRALARYFGELDRRFRHGFDRGTADAIGDADLFSPPQGGFVLLRAPATEDHDDAVGCGGFTFLDDDTAEIKRMWIDPAWRGLGLGARLLAELEARARVAGRCRVVLDTNERLDQAQAMYATHGYRAIDRYNDNPYAHHWFAKDL